MPTKSFFWCNLVSAPGTSHWLPDRSVTLHRDSAQWAIERLHTLGNTPAHKAFWRLLDQIAVVFWRASRNGIKLPIQNIHDIVRAVRTIGLDEITLVRYLRWTMGDALQAFGLRDDLPLVGLLSMLIEDTVHSSIDQAPLINAALGITIRGAGLTRARGGMRGFWQQLIAHYRLTGGELRVGCRVEHIGGNKGNFSIKTRRGTFQAAQVVSAVPASLTARLAPALVAKKLQPYLRRDATALGSAIVVFLGVPDDQVSDQPFTHHQLLQDYKKPLKHGNNMFISISTPGDTVSAPSGYRAMMISTHAPLEAWEGLSPSAYAAQKQAIGKHLVSRARRVYPNIYAEPEQQAGVYEIGTPRTYERFTSRPHGAVGGLQLTNSNANQHAIPYNLGIPGFWLAGDTTWPGLGTVACVLGSRIVAEQVAENARAPRHYSLPFTTGAIQHERAYHI